MAKEKKTEEPKIDVPAQPDRVRVLEDLLADLQLELHRFKLILQASYSKAGVSAGDWYVKVREVLGDRGQQIDATLRGVK